MQKQLNVSPIHGDTSTHKFDTLEFIRKMNKMKLRQDIIKNDNSLSNIYDKICCFDRSNKALKYIYKIFLLISDWEKDEKTNVYNLLNSVVDAIINNTFQNFTFDCAILNNQKDRNDKKCVDYIRSIINLFKKITIHSF